MSKKLVIRINNLQDVESTESYEKFEETVIRWDRVIGVAALVLTLFLVALWGGWRWLLHEDNGTAQLNETSFAAIELPAVVELPTAMAPEAETGTTLTTPAIETSETTEAIPDQPEAVVDGEEKAIVQPQATETLATEQPEAVTRVEAKPITTPFADPIAIQSERILRAQLTHTLKKGEPGEKLGSQIAMKGEGLIRVYLFTDMANLSGETLYHDWYLAGKRMARVKINVKSDQVAASSSKFIDKYMTGDWRVNVSNGRGESFVSAQFTVTH